MIAIDLSEPTLIIILIIGRGPCRNIRIAVCCQDERRGDRRALAGECKGVKCRRPIDDAPLPIVRAIIEDAGRAMAERRIELEGRAYTWTGREWYDAATHMKPPRTILHKLDERLASQSLNSDERLALAKKARLDGNFSLAEQVVREVLLAHPQHHAAAALLSGVLRERGRPAEALAVTTPFVDGGYAAIHTTRAAALCDLERWEEAKHELSRALAIRGDEEAFAVVYRIKKARPDLYD